MERKELRAEILTLVKRWDDLGLVDYITIDNMLKNELKKFGSNVMEPRSTVLEIQGGFAYLPEGFFKLKTAMKCQPYSVEPQEEVDKMWRTDYGVTKRTVNNMEWDNGSNSHYKKSYTEIIEKKEIRGSKIHFKHKPLELLSLSKNMPKDVLANSCTNRYNPTLTYDMNIIGNRFTVNFREGFVYIEYDSLPESNGDLVIPDVPVLIDFLKYYCAYRILESIWLSGESPDVADKVMYFKNESNNLKAQALTATKFENLSDTWHLKIQSKNKKNLKRFYK